jgi:hypothetical protein
MAAMLMTCAGASSGVMDGQCMATEVSAMLDDDCFEAHAALLEIGDVERKNLKSAMKTIHGACLSSTSQV